MIRWGSDQIRHEPQRLVGQGVGDAAKPLPLSSHVQHLKAALRAREPHGGRVWPKLRQFYVESVARGSRMLPLHYALFGIVTKTVTV
jgi:hypothetical protein